MLINNLLDDLGIISNTDKEVEDDPNLKQGQELMRYERNYKATVEPSLKNLQTTSSPNLDSIIEGMETKSDEDHKDILPSVPQMGSPPEDVQDLLSQITSASDKYEQAFKAYIKTQSTKGASKSKKLYNTILIDKRDKLSVKVYDTKLQDFATSQLNKAQQGGDDISWKVTVCAELAQDYNIIQGSWGDAVSLPPIRDVYNYACRDSSGKMISPNGVQLPDPNKDTFDAPPKDLTKCPLEYPIAFGASGQSPTSCCSGGGCGDGGGGLKKLGVNGGGPVSNYVATTPSGKKEPVKAWPGFAIGNYIPIGVNTQYTGGKYNIIWFESTNRDDCPKDFIYLEGVFPAYMTGTNNHEDRTKWASSTVGSQTSGCFYISPTEKSNLTTQLENLLAQILKDPTNMAEGQTTADNINAAWLKSGRTDTADQDDGICRSQFSSYFNADIATAQEPSDNTLYISPDKDNQQVTSMTTPGSFQNKLHNGTLCPQTQAGGLPVSCIKGCPGWTNYDWKGNNAHDNEPADPKNLFKTCDFNLCATGRFADPMTFTKNLVAEILAFKHQLYNSDMLNEATLKAWLALSANSNDPISLETCQDFRDAFHIYTNNNAWTNGYDLKGGGGEDHPISTLWENSGCTSDVKTASGFYGPDMDSKLYKSGYKWLKDNTSTSTGDDKPNIVNVAKNNQAFPTRRPTNTLFKTVHIYPSRVYINKYGYSQDLTAVLSRVKDDLTTLTNNCTITDDGVKTDVNKLCVGESGAFENTITQLNDRMNSPLGNCINSGNIIPQYTKNGIDPSSLTEKGITPGAAISYSTASTCPGAVKDVGSIIKDNNEKYYWLDAGGFKTLIPVGDKTKLLALLTSDANKDRCAGYFENTDLKLMINALEPVDVTKIPTATDTTGLSVSDLICSSYDRASYIEVMNKAKTLQGLVTQLSVKITANKEKNVTLKSEISAEEKHIETLIQKVNNDMDTLDAIKQHETTNEGRAESTALIKDSTKFQYLAWIIVGVILFLYSIFGISSANMSSPLHIVMLVACVIIVFIILRRIYLSGII